MKQWLRYLRENEDGFFGIGVGPSSQEKNEAGALSAIGNFSTSLGESDIGASSNFWKSILSGDPAQISKVLGPAISGVNKRGQQEKKTLAEFGTRSGGTTAAANSINDTTRSSVDSMISSLTGSAAGALGTEGSGLLNTGVGADEAAFNADLTIQQQSAAKANDIASSVSKVAQTIAVIL